MMWQAGGTGLLGSLGTSMQCQGPCALEVATGTFADLRLKLNALDDTHIVIGVSISLVLLLDGACMPAICCLSGSGGALSTAGHAYGAARWAECRLLLKYVQLRH
jgi:hypothetical protein